MLLIFTSSWLDFAIYTIHTGGQDYIPTAFQPHSHLLLLTASDLTGYRLSNPSERSRRATTALEEKKSIEQRRRIMSRASSIHESERQHGSVGELQSFDKINPFKRIRAARTASTSSATLDGNGLTGSNYHDTPNPTPAYIPATFDTSQPLRRTGSQPAVAGLFGSASPPEDDQAYPPARSEAEALARRTSGHASGSAAGGFPERQRSRGLSLVGAAANIAVAGFGIGEPDKEIVERTLSRVSTHKSYKHQRGGSFIAEPSKAYRTGAGERLGEDEESGSATSERTRVESDATLVEKRRLQALPGHGDANADPEKAVPDVETAKATPTPEETEDQIYMVRFDPGEKANPKNWSVAYRWYITAAGSLLVLNSTFASSAPSGIVAEMTEYFGFGKEVATLTVSLFVAGYCVGPLLWGPLSESFGRRPSKLTASDWATVELFANILSCLPQSSLSLSSATSVSKSVVLSARTSLRS
jgi:hypothetical protein